MKKTRLIALLCILVLAVSILPAASAGAAIVKPAAVRGTMDWTNNRVVKNGETVSLDFTYNPWSVFEKTTEGYIEYDDVTFDCAGAVTGKANVSWIRIIKNKRGFYLDLDMNEGTKSRSGKVTVKGKNFKATLKIRQFARDIVTSVVRKKNKVTVKLSPTNTPKHFFMVEMYKYKDDEGISKDIALDWDCTLKSYTFTVKKGWTYNIAFGACFHFAGGGMTGYWDDDTSFYVDSVKGTQIIK